MGLLRWAAIIGTGGLAPVKGTSPRERTAKAAEKQVRLQEQMAHPSVGQRADSHPTPAVIAAATAAQARLTALAEGATEEVAQAAAVQAAERVYAGELDAVQGARLVEMLPQINASTARIRAARNGSAENTTSEVAKLADLHERGALTDNEFAAAKAKFLDS
jgi:Short C-terminal domain